MFIEVFVENEAGRAIKNLYDEKTFSWRQAIDVSRPYPYAYGFVIATTAADGDNVDCFVITSKPLISGQRVLCRPVALMEQIEDDAIDHNVIAVPVDEPATLTATDEARLREFVTHVFDHIAGKQITVGSFLDAEAAISHVRTHADSRAIETC